MIKMQHSLSRLALPLLLTAAGAAPSSAQVLAAASAVAGAAAQAPAPATARPAELNEPDAKLPGGAAWAMLAERRQEARLLSQNGAWVEAASQWRGVLFDLQQIERFASPAQREGQAPHVAMLRREAEHEMKRAQGQLSAFWSVRDLVTPEVDSRNPTPLNSTPRHEPRPLAASRPALSPTAEASTGVPAARPATRRLQPPQELSPAVQFSALLRPPRPRLSRAAASRSKPSPVASVVRAPEFDGPIYSSEVFNQGLLTSSESPREHGGSAAVLRWAREQWWARALVQRGVDSRNAAPLRLLLAGPSPLPPGVLPIVSGSFRSAALLKVPAVPALPASALAVRGGEAASVQAAATLALRTDAPAEAGIAPEIVSAAGRTSQSSVAAAARPLPLALAPVARPGSRQAGRSWTMQIVLPSAAEAALAASLPLGSQP